jgi:hypothetical protein
MSADIYLNTNSFGKLSETADSLVIELSDSRIQFCELNSTQNTPTFVIYEPIESTASQSLSEHLISAFKHFQFSKKRYVNVLINYFDKQFTLCPTNFYNADNLRSMLEFNVGSVENRLIVTDEINSDIKLIYAIDEQLKSTLDQLFPNHQLKHSLSVLSKLMLNAEEFAKENVLLSIHSNYIEVVLKQDHKLILANQFAIKTQEDVLYYVLFILEQYQLNPLFVNISVVGNVDSNSSLMSSIRKYIKNIRLATGHKSLNWTEVQGMPQHFNYSLLNRLFCE